MLSQRGGSRSETADCALVACFCAQSVVCDYARGAGYDLAAVREVDLLFSTTAPRRRSRPLVFGLLRRLSASVDVEVVRTFESTRRGFAQRDVWIELPYFDERLDPVERDKINIVFAEIYDPGQGAEIARAIDIHFDERDHQTFTQED